LQCANLKNWENMEKGNKIILVLGILAIAAGVIIIIEASSYLKQAVQTKGKVVHVIGTSYKIQYFTDDGTEKVYQGSGKTHGYREGNTIKVWYRTTNPDRVRLSDRKKETRTLFFIGAVGILLGIYPLFTKKKDNTVS
jgi:uncharacterized membrane protein HdeD (DUF308 family)